jgi:hypothetical protein
MSILDSKKNGCRPRMMVEQSKPMRACCPAYVDEPHDPECSKPDAYWLHMEEPASSAG